MRIQHTVLDSGALPHFELPEAFDAAYRGFLRRLGHVVPVPPPTPDVVPPPPTVPPPAIPPNIIDPPLPPTPPAPVVDPVPEAEALRHAA
jgi:hypothetical protein